ncbi:MAG: hypothetical protein H6510_15715 [Acidobacteria bacterium]|nr:hypothetical protein [Acidobacteriota bacterium]MCB9399259.1 hypothetical protein [Acidobacteriota bacterium]
MSEYEEEETSPGKTILIGIAFLVGSAFLFWYFWDFEHSDQESIRMQWILALAYKIGGKWLISGIGGLIGAFLVFSGIKEYRAENS